MAKQIKIRQEIIDKLRLVEEFIGKVYDGKKQYKSRIAYIANTLNDIITELEGKWKK